jgi:23S rRNA (adenine2503-C2)-methyltransferase
MDKKDIMIFNKRATFRIFLYNGDKAFRGTVKFMNGCGSKGAHSFEDMTNVSKEHVPHARTALCINHIMVDNDATFRRRNG